MSLKNAIEKYLEWKKTHTNIAANRYAVRLNQFGNFVGWETQLCNITGDHVIAFHHRLKGQSYQKGNKIRVYSPATCAYSTRVLKNFFLFWNGRNQSSVNPKEILGLRYVVPIKKTVTIEEFEIMSRSLDNKFFDDLVKKLTIHLLWDTGMRVSELCELGISDISSVHPEYGVRSATIRTRKTMRYNLVVWSKETDQLLNQYLGLRLCCDTSSDALIISSRRDTARSISVRTVQRWVDEITDKCGLDDGITPHSFRHGKAQHILNNPQGNIRDVFAILRHAKPESCFHYLSLNERQFFQVALKYLTPTKPELSTGGACTA